MNIRFSVIIPAYNSDKTIDRCLSSLLQSQREDFEVVVVNDGSTDNTGPICREYSLRDKRIKLVEKNNGGVSSARNAGLRCAVGDYICFVDSDDFVADDFFEQIDRGMTDNPDLLIMGSAVYDGIITQNRAKPSEIVAIEDPVAFLCRKLRQQKLNAPCGKVFKKELIESENVRFPEGLHIGEDKVFVIRYIMGIKSVRTINEPVYIISVENPNSLSRKNRDDLCDSILAEHQMLFEAVLQSKLNIQAEKQYLRALNFSYYRSAYTVLDELNKFVLSVEEKRNRAITICIRYAENNRVEELDFPTRLLAWPIRHQALMLIFALLKMKRKRQ